MIPLLEKNFDLASYDYTLPKNLIALQPAKHRPSARMLVFDLQSKKISHKKVLDLPDYLPQDAALFLNDSKVLPARLLGKRNSGGYLEILLLKDKKIADNNIWQCKILNSRKLKEQESFTLCDGRLKATLESKNTDGSFDVSFFCEIDFFELLQKYGETPLPPYILKQRKKTQFSEDLVEDFMAYQTVYAKAYGSVAAPTAGLHFSKELLQKINAKISVHKITLHVGLGTFSPVKSSDIRDHKIHSEEYYLTQESLNALQQAKSQNKKILAVGTTTVRVIESLFQNKPTEQNFADKNLFGSTQLFIYPPYQFQAISAMLTNFHLPKSSLMMLVAAFCGLETLQELYHTAIKEKYRFYSYGDCMLLHNFANPK